MEVLKYILSRLKEKSTWIGIAGFASVVGITLNPEQTAAIGSAGVAFAALVLAFTKEKE